MPRLPAHSKQGDPDVKAMTLPGAAAAVALPAVLAPPAQAKERKKL